MANNTVVAGNQQQQTVNKPASSGKHGNVLPLWGNEKTMNLNPMILTNVLSSPYFKVQLYELKTYHEVVDEIYFKVTHVEPWEKGSRKTAGQTGMCGGVRGVGTGGIVSTAFCLLYKLFTLKLTRKQVMGLITHTDSPYIRALGFMYIRYTQPPPDLLDWFDAFLDDEEELDVKAGGGCVMNVGEMLRSFLTKLEWFSTLFPRIPVPVQKMIDLQMKSRPRKNVKKDGKEEAGEPEKHAERRRSRYTQPPPDLLDWFDAFLDDEEELDVKAGGGCVMNVGEMLRSFLTKLEWFSTLFPRIPVPVQKMIDLQMKSRPIKNVKKDGKEEAGEPEKHAERRRSRSPKRSDSPRRSPKRSRSQSRHRDGHGSTSFDRELERERDRQRKEREGKDKDRDRVDKERHRSRSPERAVERRHSRSKEKRRSLSKSRDKKNDRKEREKENEKSKKKERDYDKERGSERDREKEKSKEKGKGDIERKPKDEKEEKRHRDDRKVKRHSRSQSRERKHRSRSHSKNDGSKRSRSKSKERSNKHKTEKSNKRSRSRSKERSNKHKSEKSNKRSRSGSKGRTDADEKSKRSNHSRSKERSHKRSKSTERSHKKEHGDGKDHSSKHERRRSQSTERAEQL
ncbi:UNVERIFIED_CONTAM: hypothetical protein FKN15_039880 [Acipenser sinensis]